MALNSMFTMPEGDASFRSGSYNIDNESRSSKPRVSWLRSQRLEQNAGDEVQVLSI